MKKELLFGLLVISIFCFVSCTTSKKEISLKDIPEHIVVSVKGIPEYINEGGRKNFYRVDSIYIDSPIIVITNEGFRLTMSKKVYDEYTGQKDFFFNHPDVYLVTDMLLGDEYYLAPENTDYCYNFGNPLPGDKKYVKNIYSYHKEPVFFVLYLVNGEYYNAGFIPFGSKELELKHLKFSYYKLVMPVCGD